MLNQNFLSPYHNQKAFYSQKKKIMTEGLKMAEKEGELPEGAKTVTMSYVDMVVIYVK